MEQFDTYMSDADALMWNVEKDPLLRSTIVTVVQLDRSPSWERLIDRIERGAYLIPRLRQRVVTPFLRLGPPHWSADPHFDLSYHLRRVRAPEPATFDTVLDLARTVAMASFDRARPLWEFTLVEGLRDGGAALIMKVHQSMTDGVGGMRLAMMLFDLEREPSDPGPAGEVEELETYTPFGLVGPALELQRDRALGIARRALITALESPRRVLRNPRRSLERAALVGGSIARMLAPALTPQSPIMTERTLARRLDTLELPLDDLKRAAKAVGGTLNDAFVAAVVGGMQRYHQRHGPAPDDLRMTMPINVRKEGTALGGNRFTPARFLVPLSVTDPGERITALGALARQVRDEPAVQMTDALATVLNQLPTAVTTALFGAMLKGADFVTSNVPGVPFPVYLAGAELRANYAFGPLSGSAANITLVSHCGTCCIGVNTDSVAIPDTDEFMEALADGFAEVVALGRAAEPPLTPELRDDELTPVGSGFTPA
jgi:diacylglycerol O-acyltransferase / wax synthase